MSKWSLRDRVEVVGHDQEGVIVAVDYAKGEVRGVSVAVLNSRGDRVVLDLGADEIAPKGRL